MKVLLIDDNPYDRVLIKHQIDIIWPDTQWVEVTGRQSLDEALLQAPFDLVLTDYQLKWSTGLDMLRMLGERFQGLPIIMVTDTGSEEVAVEAMKQGLCDYVLKTHLSRLPIAIRECREKQQLRNQQEILAMQLQQAQKMESLGLLVSGMAHDFNNLLAGIMGYAQQGLKHAKGSPECAEYFQHIYTRSEQGARMTRQLLTFARGNQLDPTVVNINELIKRLSEFVGTLLGPDIILEIVTDPSIPMLYADPTQLEQILMNLCVNARDAMPKGGTLRLATRTVTVESGKRNTVDEKQPGSGTYIQIVVADTGIGMTQEVKDRLFEPFFTTKEVGRGTGLGLAVVYGIVKQHRGFIEVESTPGKGTQFALYFPLTDIAAPQHQEQPDGEEAQPLELPASEQVTVLLVEDDPDIQAVANEVLTEEGYHVLLASDGEEGFRMVQEHANVIRLVIADVMMPRMRGKAFQELVHQRYPHMKILVMSGYQPAQLRQRDLLEPHSDFLQKPFDLDTLCAKVRELLLERS